MKPKSGSCELRVASNGAGPADIRRRFVRRCARDHAYYASQCHMIRDKKNQLIPLNMNSTQKALAKRIQDAWAAGHGFKAFILKARQRGFSTVIESLGHKTIALVPHTRGLVMAFDNDTTTVLWKMFKRFHKNLPENFRPDPKQAKVPDGDKEVDYGDMDSSCKFHTAGATGTSDYGHGETLTFVHLSEFARYKDPESNLKAVMNAYTDEPGSFCIIETTADGANTFAHNMWKGIEAGESDPDQANGSIGAYGDWVAIFAGAWEHEEYRRKLTPGFRLSDEEKDVKERVLARFEYEVPNMYFSWRRWCIGNKCLGNMDTFHEQYPEFPEDAWLSSSRALFDKKALDRGDVLAERNPPRVGELWGSDTKPQFHEDARGPLSIWAEPDKGEVYTMGVDTCGGVEDGDWAVIPVWNIRTGEQVAEFRDKLAPDLLAHAANRLGRWYGIPYTVPEVNNEGESFRDTFKHLYPVHRIFKQERYDEKRARVTKKLGWRTTAQNKFELIDNFRALFRDYQVTVFSKPMLGEMRSYVVREGGTYGGDDGCHDDCVMAGALGVWGMTRRPWREKKEAEPMVWCPELRRYLPQSAVEV